MIRHTVSVHATSELALCSRYFCVGKLCESPQSCQHDHVLEHALTNEWQAWPAANLQS